VTPSQPPGSAGFHPVFGFEAITLLDAHRGLPYFVKYVIKLFDQKLLTI
jgi:hypothetical protein